MNILGIGAYQHDASAALLIDGKPVAAAAQERFDRKKYSSSFPLEAIHFCLAEAQISLEQVDAIAYYMDYSKYLQWFMHKMGGEDFKRNLDSYQGQTQQLVHDFTYRLNLMDLNLRRIREILGFKGRIEAVEHHKAHAACAFFNSPFSRAALLTLDAIGEWETTTLGRAQGHDMEVLDSYRYPHSLGTVYKAFTVHLGFHQNDAGKVMGLASYGDPTVYADAFDTLVPVSNNSFQVTDGFLLHHFPARYWSRSPGDLSEKFLELFGPTRRKGDPIIKRHEDLAAGLQAKLEEAAIALARGLYQQTGEENLCLAGGVGLNSVMNYKILQESGFTHLFVPPASGDDGASLGAAQWLYHVSEKRPRNKVEFFSPYLGPCYSNEQIESTLKKLGLPVKKSADLVKEAAELIAQGKIIGWFQGRMECGPRALGNRSILADPRDPRMKDTINARVKFREPFRPFAPAATLEHAKEYFDLDRPSEYMLLVCDVLPSKRTLLPAITHIDGTARLQTVTPHSNPDFYRLISQFGEITGIHVVLNTSFNVKGEPIVNTPEQAIQCFQRTGIDVLFLHDYVLSKEVRAE